MLRRTSWFWTGICASLLSFGFATVLPAGEIVQTPQLPYDLANVRHIEAFIGSPQAKKTLAQHGFVVTEEQFRQIFQPYLPSRQAKMPTFITVDSAWHTYHVLVEDGVQQVEMGQSRLLQRFSQRLHQLAAAHQGPPTAVYRDLAAFAAVGWAAQDSTCLQRLPADERTVVAQTLEAMKSGGSALFFELPLQAENFRPAGFYTKTPELARYFVARRWYSTSAFRLKSETETLRALYLTLLVESDTEMKRLYRQLTVSPETMVGPTDDPGIVEYGQVASKLAAGPLTEEQIPQILIAFRREANKLAGPRINDQFLLPEQFTAREAETKGMRLFGACQLPSAILFQKTTEPTIANRVLPSGVDVFAAGPLACDAGRRVLKGMEPDPVTVEAICRSECGPLPDSLHGQAMQLLHLLHEPLPGTAPMALRTPAWQDKQLNTVLGAWAEERHTWVLHTKQAGAPGCMFEEPPGYVSPYPKFYRQLGQLARRAATVLTQVTAEPDFAAAGRDWLKARQPPTRGTSADREGVSAEWLQEQSEGGDLRDRMAQALAEYFRTLGKDVEAASTLDRARAWVAIDTAARRCAEDKGPTNNDRRCMRAFLRSSQGSAAQLLPEFATLCDQLTTIADKELAGQPLDPKEIQLIENYGETLARFHFYEGMTWLNPRDDFACVAPVFNNSLRGKTLYVGVGRPEAIYVVLFDGKQLVLHRGAVLDYREFSRPLGEGPDDNKWREDVNAARAPSPPAWTASFRCTISRQELVQLAKEQAARLREGKVDVEDFAVVGHEATLVRIERLLKKWQLLKVPLPTLKKDGELTEEEEKAAEKAKEARQKDEEDCSRLLEVVLERAVNEDVPDLLDKVLPAVPKQEIWRVSDCLENLNWQPYRTKLLALVHHSRPEIASWAAVVLGTVPQQIDVTALAKVYEQQLPHVRAEYCYLIGRSQQPGTEGKRVLAAGLLDKSWDVRCQAAKAVAECGATSAEILAGVRAGVTEEEPVTAAAMVKAAAALGLTDTAPRMLARLKKYVERSRLSIDDTHGVPEWANEEAKSLTAALIAGLGELKYLPAKDVFRAFVFPNAKALQEYQFGKAAYEALLRIEPQNKKKLLAEVFQDTRCPDYILQHAIVEVTETNDIEYVKAILPLFENVARSGGNGQQSEAVWAAWHIAPILEDAMERDGRAVELFEKIRGALLKQTHEAGVHDALAALKYFDPAAAARECLSVALDKGVDRNARTGAIAILQDSPKPWPIRELLSLVDEPSSDEDTSLSVAYHAAQTVGRLSDRLDPTVPQEAATVRMVRTTLDEMLKGPRYEAAVAGLTEMLADKDVLLDIALNRSLPYATRAYVLSVTHDGHGPEDAKRLIPLLGEDTRPNDEKPTIALCAANAIAALVSKEPWDGEESPAEFLRRARAWAESAESK